MNEQQDAVADAVGQGKGDIGALVAAAVRGQSLDQIATTAGVSVSTVRRRLAEPEVQAAVREARGQHMAQLLGRHVDLADRSADRLLNLVDSADESIALRAIALVYSNTTKLTASVDFAERLDQLEATASESDGHYA